MNQKYEGFRDFEDFFGYCKIHSESPRALFSIDHINMLCEMAGFPIYREINKSGFYEREDNSDVMIANFHSIYSDEMKIFLDKINRRSNSIIVECENIKNPSQLEMSS